MTLWSLLSEPTASLRSVDGGGGSKGGGGRIGDSCWEAKTTLSWLGRKILRWKNMLWTRKETSES